MRQRPIVAAFLAGLLSFSFLQVRPAHASEPETTADAAEAEAPPEVGPPIVWSAENAEAWQSRIGLGLARRSSLVASPPVAVTLGPGPLREIRLSSGAKTAIIVGAIVVGVLLIVGVIAIGKPHRHL